MREADYICDYLAFRTRERPDQAAVIAGRSRLTFRELEDLSNRCAAGLEQLGFEPNMRTVLMVRPGVEFTLLSFALIKLGAILVFVDPGMGWSNLGRCLEEARPRAFVGVPLAQAARRLFGWARQSVRLSVTVGRPVLGGVGLSRVMRLGQQGRPQGRPSGLDEPVAIAFTSGSTGVPKGVVLTHRMFVAQAELLRRSYQIEPGEVDLATFPLFALYDPALGMTTVFPRMNFTRPGKVHPQAILDPIRRYRVTHMFGSPALLERVEPFAARVPAAFRGIKRILSAGAPVPASLLERLQAQLGEEAEVHTPYGATEALPVCSISSRERLALEETGRGVCVGRPLEGIGLAVIRVTDEPIPEWDASLSVPSGEVGELVVWGENVSRCYIARPEANRLAKISHPGGGVRHRMGDLGYLDEKGRVWFCGRKSHRVRTGRGTLFTVPSEQVFNRHPGVRRTALVGVGSGSSQRAVLCVELKGRAGRRRRRQLAEELRRLGSTREETATIETFLFHPGFPVDIRHNAKIFREKLALWAARRLP